MKIHRFLILFFAEVVSLSSYARNDSAVNVGSRTAPQTAASVASPSMDSCMQSKPEAWAKHLTELRNVWAVVSANCQNYGVSATTKNQDPDNSPGVHVDIDTGALTPTTWKEHNSERVTPDTNGSYGKIIGHQGMVTPYYQFTINNNSIFHQSELIYGNIQSGKPPLDGLSKLDRDPNYFNSAPEFELQRNVFDQYHAGLYQQEMILVGRQGNAYCTPQKVRDFNTASTYTRQQLLARLARDVCGSSSVSSTTPATPSALAPPTPLTVPQARVSRPPRAAVVAPPPPPPPDAPDDRAVTEQALPLPPPEAPPPPPPDLSTIPPTTSQPTTAVRAPYKPKPANQPLPAQTAPAPVSNDFPPDLPANHPPPVDKTPAATSATPTNSKSPTAARAKSPKPANQPSRAQSVPAPASDEFPPDLPGSHPPPDDGPTPAAAPATPTSSQPATVVRRPLPANKPLAKVVHPPATGPVTDDQHNNLGTSAVPERGGTSTPAKKQPATPAAKPKKQQTKPVPVTSDDGRLVVSDVPTTGAAPPQTPQPNHPSIAKLEATPKYDFKTILTGCDPEKTAKNYSATKSFIQKYYTECANTLNHKNVNDKNQIEKIMKSYNDWNTKTKDLADYLSKFHQATPSNDTATESKPLDCNSADVKAKVAEANSSVRELSSTVCGH